MIWLAACAHAPAELSRHEERARSADCCIDIEPERLPPWLIASVEPAAPVIGRIIGNIVWRDGYLAREDARRRVEAELQPLDIIVVSSKGRLSGRTIPGLFGHVAVYLGNEAQLSRAGAWHDPRVAAHHAKLRAGRGFIEADQHGVHLSRSSIVFNTDRVVILRAAGLSAARKRRAIGDFLDRVGTKFDFNFDNANTDRLYCAQLVCHVLPELRIPSRGVYGRETIVPDEIVLKAARGRLPLRPVLYVRGRPDGWELASSKVLIEDLALTWRR
jgi:hypothetical protein